jgi:DNA-directed RNA polymerase specialized sigma24 family protein
VRDDALVAYERVGAAAWRLAIWIVRDERLAADIVVEAFASRPVAPSGARNDAGLLVHVRRRAIAVAHGHGSCLVGSRDAVPGASRARVDIDAATMRDTVGALSEPQRAVIELALFGGLSVTSIATATGASRAQVLRLMVEAMQALRLALALRGPPAP